MKLIAWLLIGLGMMFMIPAFILMDAANLFWRER